ncbi:hypothetical protein K443DRAFT_679078 [Laccaria amethystina LaAM-08-1]|uniref:Uncharacterized protein n=1 Tax=Laccaria amethystina LaAM-08-1 TaxID=1095629 RepID=A0A0C9XS92_9AGAR|nr:hypothetical protein K443DRAFT_679078 [Laccaria amethystina LaAM-08-1]
MAILGYALCELFLPFIHRPDCRPDIRGLFVLRYDSLLRSAFNPSQTASIDWDRKTESVDLGSVMVPGDILRFEGMDLERMPNISSTALTWSSIITRQEHIKFIGVEWVLHTPPSPDGCRIQDQAVCDMWCIIRFYPWSSITKLPFELMVYLCAVLGPIAWAVCLGIFVLPRAPLSRFFLSIGIGVVSEVATLLVWKRWLGYPVWVPLCSIVRLWCVFVWREILRKQSDGESCSSV